MEQTLSNFKVETRPRGSSWGHALLPPHTLRKRRFRLWAAALLQCVICTSPQSSKMAGKSPKNGDFNWTIMIIVMCGKCTPYWLVVVAGSYCWGGHLCGAVEISHDHWPIWRDLEGKPRIWHHPTVVTMLCCQISCEQKPGVPVQDWLLHKMNP